MDAARRLGNWCAIGPIQSVSVTNVRTTCPLGKLAVGTQRAVAPFAGRGRRMSAFIIAVGTSTVGLAASRIARSFCPVLHSEAAASMTSVFQKGRLANRLKRWKIIPIGPLVEPRIRVTHGSSRASGLCLATQASLTSATNSGILRQMEIPVQARRVMRFVLCRLVNSVPNPLDFIGNKA